MILPLSDKRSTLAQIPKVFSLGQHTFSSVYLPSQGCPRLHQVNLVGLLQTCTQQDSHCFQVARKPARPRECEAGTQLLPQNGSSPWLNIGANCKTTTRSQEVPTNSFEQLSHSVASIPQASDSLTQSNRRSKGD